MVGRIFLSIILFSSSVCFAGGDIKNDVPYNNNTSKFEYTAVVEVNGADKKTLYDRSKAWSVNTFSNKDFLIDEPENDKLIDNGNFSTTITMNAGMVKVPYTYTVVYTIETNFKEGKYKYTITNIKLTQNANATTTENTLETFVKQHENMGMGKNYMKNFEQDVCVELDKRFKEVITGLRKAMKGEVQKKNDW